ncbi:hypothetical protein CHGG_02014 [Chaetomium globosum CBS 148.51]|uniref:ubiquitinyl hydrolase 1 n=1 Tax=Chaetomium globosum (strain ATCC 6205 / CBS 148.51 / DSM 1962 / NBRC 6347 / NRRL 1970) TaxID=306901 RepID=Q2HCP0_CHAGB|nr:uncharacterized protein CHGG_02014 [Chaetomium globosum CBS 148.51]EAQ93779.1 hypothetical protein CHGG_02014 [Chaetomium globosum CBS 148.51]
MPNLVAIDVSVTDDRIRLVFSDRAVASAYAAYLRAQDLRPPQYQTIPGYQRSPQLHTTTKEVSLSLPNFITWFITCRLPDDEDAVTFTFMDEHEAHAARWADAMLLFEPAPRGPASESSSTAVGDEDDYYDYDYDDSSSHHSSSHHPFTNNSNSHPLPPPPQQPLPNQQPPPTAASPVPVPLSTPEKNDDKSLRSSSTSAPTTHTNVQIRISKSTLPGRWHPPAKYTLQAMLSTSSGKSSGHSGPRTTVFLPDYEPSRPPELKLDDIDDIDVFNFYNPCLLPPSPIRPFPARSHTDPTLNLPAPPPYSRDPPPDSMSAPGLRRSTYTVSRRGRETNPRRTNYVAIMPPAPASRPRSPSPPQSNPELDLVSPLSIQRSPSPLTCLSFYYSELNYNPFRDGLLHVLGSGETAAEYDRWTQGLSSLPEHLSHWNAINLDHQQQFDELWSRLRFNRNVLDHYMNTFVFPAHARQFEVKIQASGWDLPLLPMSSDPTVPSRAISTGFSGTTTSRMLLPLESS